MIKRLSCIAALIAVTSAAKDYLCVMSDCGAVPKTSLTVALEDTLTNAKALETCLQKASKEGPKRVVIPKGFAFSAMATRNVNLTDVALQIDGVWEAATYNNSWPLKPSSKEVLDFLTFEDCKNLTIQGTGIVDGLGYDWWVREWALENKYGRPMLLKYVGVQDTEVTGVKWLNSPFWTMSLTDMDSAFVHDLEIRVDILKQRGWISDSHKDNSFDERYMEFVHQFMLHFFSEYSPIIDFLFSGKTEWDSFPTFPLNTDGIDPAGSNVTIKNVKITNWDDAVAVKPSHKTDKVAKDGCSQDIHVQNMTVLFGIGAVIGSVPPSDNHACVRRVHFKDVHFDYPVKAIYVKTNPGYTGSGEIKDIFYENFDINFPLWFGIYIGPQQQEQPDGTGPGCFTYPFEGCETQPLIDVRNITLKNVTSKSGFVNPGIVRCNASNPCEDINFIDVQVDSWTKDMNWTYISEYAHGSNVNSYPDPYLGPQSDQVFDLYTVEKFLTFTDQVIGFANKKHTDIVGWQTLFGIVVWALSMALDGGHF